MKKLKSKLAGLLCLVMLFTEVIPAWAVVADLQAPVEAVASPSDAEDAFAEELSEETASPSDAEEIKEEAGLAGAGEPAEETDAAKVKKPTVCFSTGKGNFYVHMKNQEPGYLEDLDQAVYYEGNGVFRLCKDLEASIAFNQKYTWELNLDGHTLKGYKNNSVVSVRSTTGTVTVNGAGSDGKHGVLKSGSGTVEDDGGLIFNNGTLTVKNVDLGEENKITSCTHAGGAIYNKSDLTLDDVKIMGTKAFAQGGAIYNSGNLTVENSGTAEYGVRILKCDSSQSGKAVYNAEGGTITLNAALYGDTVLVNDGTLTSGGQPEKEQIYCIPVENTEKGTIDLSAFASTVTGTVKDESKILLAYLLGDEKLFLTSGVPLLQELKKACPGETSFYLWGDGGRPVTETDRADRTSANRKVVSGDTEVRVLFETNCSEVSVRPQTVFAGTAPDKPEITREGYEAVEWYRDAALTEKYDFTAPVFEDCTLYAKWISTARVTVYFDSVVGTKVPSQTILKGERATVPNDPSPYVEEIRFVCWLYKGRIYDFSKPVNENITLIAKWVKDDDIRQMLHVHYYGEQVDDVIYFHSYVPVLPDPVRPGYAFRGWFSDAPGYTPFNFFIPTEDYITHIYAGWIKLKEYTVSFDSLGGTAISGQKVFDGKTVKKPSPDPTKSEEGKQMLFLGWCRDKECTELYDFTTPVRGNLTLYAHWEEPSVVPVKVTFDSNGGSPVGQQVLAKGSSAAEPSAPTKELFDFTGWYADRECTVKYDFSRSVVKDLTLYAGWKSAPPVYVKVTFETGDGKDPQIQLLLKGKKATEPAAPVREGFFFMGWYGDGSCTKRFDFDTAIEQDTTVYAGWKEKKKLTVTFDSKGGSAVSPQTVYEQGTAVKPQDPTKTVETVTYRFSGWCSDEACRKPYDFSKPVTANMTLYARWLEPSVTVVHVSYETNGGSHVPEETLAKGDTAHKPEDPTMTAYTFCGWYSDGAFENAYDFNTPVNDSITLYAKWVEAPVIPVKVSIDYRNGTEPEVQTILSGEVAEQPADPVREGYFFTGWFREKECTSYFNFTVPVYNDTTVYAGWRAKNRYTVTFNSQGGSSVPVQNVLELDKAERPATDPVKIVEGVKLQFCGWCTDAKCTSKYDFDTPVTGNLTLYAHWLMPSVVTVTVTFDSKGGSNVGDQTVVRGDKAVKPADPVRDPYVFTGWYTDEECKLKFDFDTALDDDIELYAGWELAPVIVVRVKFETGDGTEPEEQIILQYEKPERPADPVRREYFFAGWYADPSCTKRYDFNAPVAEDTVVYAGWTKKQTFTVKFDTGGGSTVADASVLEQDPVKRPNDPVKTVEDVVYRFCGWYSDEACRIVYDFSKPVTKDMTLYARWLEPSVEIVHVSYDSNGGSAVRPETLVKGDRAQRPDDPVYEHFTFAGWYSDDTLSVQYDFGKAVNEDITLYAKWLFTPVSIVHATFKLQNGENDAVETVLTGDPVSEPTEPTYENHFFMGWYTSPSCTQVWDFRDGIYEDTSIYAGWKAKQIFEVSFDTRGGSEAPATQEIRELDKVSKPADPTKTVESVTYQFCGWCTDEAGKYLYDFNSPVTKSMTLYARWLEPGVIPVKVTFDSAGGSKVSMQVLASPGYAEKPSDPVRNGYRFICWQKDGAEFDFSTAVTEDITLTAKWLEIPVIPVWLIFETQGGSYIEPQLVASGSTAQRPVHDPVKGGYRFGGWFEDQYCTVKYDFDTVMDRDRVVYAGWNEYPEYTFRFESNGGSAVENQKIREGSRAQEPDPPVREGYTFLFWCKDAQFREIYDFNSAVYCDTTVYARWLKNQVTKYKVHFDTGGGSAVADQEIASGEKATKPADPVKTGYRFTGWYSDRGCSTAYNFNSSVTADLTLYAGWKKEAEKVKVHFESNGGTYVPDQVITAGEKAVKPEDPTQSYYRFSGWYSDAPCRIAYDFDTPVTADLTLYAGWIYTGGGGGGGGGGSSGGGGGGGGIAVARGIRSGSDAYDAAGKKIGIWQQDAKGWWLKKLDNTWPRDEWVNCTSNGVLNWYYFGPDGYMYTGFYTDKNGRTFYLNKENSALLGAMATGWVAVGGKWYYFNTVSDGTKGAMFVNRTTPDGYKVGADGVWIP